MILGRRPRLPRCCPLRARAPHARARVHARADGVEGAKKRIDVSFERMTGANKSAEELELVSEQRLWRRAVDDAVAAGVPRSALKGLLNHPDDKRAYKSAHQKLQGILASFISSGL